MIRPGRSFAVAADRLDPRRCCCSASAVSRWAASARWPMPSVGASQMARTQVGLLASELQKFRLLPLVLTEYPDVRTVLGGRGAPRARRAAQRQAGAAVEPHRRRGDLRDRPQRAHHRGEQLAPADQLRRPGSTASGPISRARCAAARPSCSRSARSAAGPACSSPAGSSASGRILGVIVVKVEFDRLEAAWARQPGPTFVTDRHGVIIITSRPRMALPLHPAARAATIAADSQRPPVRQSAAAAARPRRRRRRRSGKAPAATPAGSCRADIPTGLEGGALHYLAPAGRGRGRRGGDRPRRHSGRARPRRRSALAWLYRARREAAAAGRGARGRWRARSTLRTAELRETNERLTEQSRERERSRPPLSRRARGACPGQPARLDRPDHRRRRARDQPAGRRDPDLRRKCRHLSRPGQARTARVESRPDRRAHRPDRRDHRRAARLRPARGAGDRRGRDRAGGRRRAAPDRRPGARGRRHGRARGRAGAGSASSPTGSGSSRSSSTSSRTRSTRSRDGPIR